MLRNAFIFGVILAMAASAAALPAATIYSTSTGTVRTGPWDSNAWGPTSAAVLVQDSRVERDLTFVFSMPAGYACTIDTGDGSLITVTGPVTEQEYQHTYLTEARYRVRAYGDWDAITYFKATSNDGLLMDVASTPRGVTTYFNTTWSRNVFGNVANAPPALHGDLYFLECYEVEYVSDDWPLPTAPGSRIVFRNGLASAQADDVVIDLAAHGAINGVLRLDECGPLTAASSAALLTLTTAIAGGGLEWTVNHE